MYTFDVDKFKYGLIDQETADDKMIFAKHFLTLYSAKMQVRIPLGIFLDHYKWFTEANFAKPRNAVGNRFREHRRDNGVYVLNRRK